MSEKEKYAVTAVIRIGGGEGGRGGQNVRRPIISRNFEENGWAIPSFSFLFFLVFLFFTERSQHKGEVHRGCKRLQHLARPRPACIKLDGDVRAAGGGSWARAMLRGAQRSSSRLGGPFSRSLSAVMECINIGEPAGPSTNAPCILRPGVPRAPVRFYNPRSAGLGIRPVGWNTRINRPRRCTANRQRIPGPTH